MGNSLVAVPSDKALSTMASKSRVSRNDLIKLKDKLKKVQLKHGGVSKEEWSNCCYACGLLDDDYVENLFRMFDVYNTEWVDFKEFAVYSALVARDGDKDKIDYCYRAFDKNGSGTLDLEELTKMMSAVARTLKRTNYALPGLHIDPEMPSFEDTPKEQKQLEGIAEDLFEALDVNADGEIQHKEFVKGAHKVPLIKKTLAYFQALSENLPENLDVAEDDGKKKKKGAKKDDASASSDAKKKKKGSAKGSAKGKKGGKKGSKKGKSDDTLSATASGSDKKKKKGADKGSKGKKGGKDDKKKKGSAKGSEKAKKGSQKDKKKGSTKK